MADYLIIVCFVLVLLQKCRSTGKCDLGNVLFHFIGIHSQTSIGKRNLLVFGIHNNADLHILPFRNAVLSDNIKFFKLCDSIAAVAYQLAGENIMIAVHPFLDYRKNIFTVDR